MKIDKLIADLLVIRDQIGNVEVILKESSGLYNKRINVGWDEGHIIDDDGEGIKVALIVSYVMRGS